MQSKSWNLPFIGRRPETVAGRASAVKRVISAMKDQMDEPMSLGFLAKRAMVSSSHLDHIFRQVTGVCPRRFMGALRLAHAKRMLLDTGMKVIDISLEAGYNSLGTFTRRFTRLVGVPPLELRSLSENGVVLEMRSAKSAANNPKAEDTSKGVRGQITAPNGFSGLIFIGLFHGAIPESRPAACTILSQPGSFSIEEVPDGAYYVFAIAFEWSDDPLTYFNNESALRGPLQSLVVQIQEGKGPGELLLELRPAEITDPPILLAIPALVVSTSQREGLEEPK